jgi:hypothetical protein
MDPRRRHVHRLNGGGDECAWPTMRIADVIMANLIADGKAKRASPPTPG